MVGWVEDEWLAKDLPCVWVLDYPLSSLWVYLTESHRIITPALPELLRPLISLDQLTIGVHQLVLLAHAEGIANALPLEQVHSVLVIE